ncbi:MAG: hypothetical protein IJZ13_01425, partial [Clostridia bacterium]|nr:hypothetical protein [Clostridia bacterium]
MSFTGGIVILAVLLLRLLLKKAPRRFSYLLWAVVLLRLVCPFTRERALSLSRVNPTPRSTDICTTDTPRVETGLPVVDEVVNGALSERYPETETVTPTPAPEDDVTDTPVTDTPVIPAPDVTPSVPDTPVTPLATPMQVASVVWLCGIAVMAVYSVVSLWRLRRRLVGAMCLKDNVWLADHINTAFVLGLFHPKIYLPSTVREEEREYILLHEQTHIRHGDHIVRLIAFIVLAVYWFHPLVWVAFLLSTRDMEMACDESVLKTLGPDIRTAYSQSLLSFTTGHRRIAATPLAFGEGDPKSRIRNILNYKKPALWAIIAGVTACCVAAVCLLTTAAPAKQPEESDLPPNTVAFAVQEEGDAYLCEAVYDETTPQLALRLILKEADSENTVQTIELPVNECFTTKPVYAIDVTFDGYKDLLVPQQRPAGYAAFLAYRYDPDQKQFVELPDFENVYNPIVRADDQQILSNHSVSQVDTEPNSYYKKYTYDSESGTYLGSYSLHIIATAEGQLQYSEYRLDENRASELVNQVVVSIDAQKTDAKTAPYYEDGSFWDLDGAMWRSSFWEERTAESEEEIVYTGDETGVWHRITYTAESGKDTLTEWEFTLEKEGETLWYTLKKWDYVPQSKEVVELLDREALVYGGKTYVATRISDTGRKQGEKDQYGEYALDEGWISGRLIYFPVGDYLRFDSAEGAMEFSRKRELPVELSKLQGEWYEVLVYESDGYVRDSVLTIDTANMQLKTKWRRLQKGAGTELTYNNISYGEKGTPYGEETVYDFTVSDNRLICEGVMYQSYSYDAARNILHYGREYETVYTRDKTLPEPNPVLQGEWNYICYYADTNSFYGRRLDFFVTNAG